MRTIGLLLAALVVPIAASADTTPVLPKVDVIPELDFARHATLGFPAISPDGEHIAVSVHVTEKGEDKYQLAVLHLPDLSFSSRLDFADRYLPIDITWVDNTRLVLSTGEETGFSEAPRSTGDVLAVDFDGKNKKVLYSDRLRDSIAAQRNILKIPVGFGAISGRPDKANGHFYLTVYPAAETGGMEGQANKTLLFDIDARNGNVTDLATIDKDGYEFLVHDGVARYAWGVDNDLKPHVFQRADAQQKWQELAEAVVGKHLEPLRVSPDGKQLYALGNPAGGPDELVVSNLDGSERKVLAGNPRASITRVFFTPPPRVPYAAVAYDGKPIITYLADNKYAAALKALNAKFADHLVQFAGASEDYKRAIVFAASDRDPGTFALFDTDSGNLRPLYQTKPWLKAEQLAERRPFRFKAGSGVELEGFLTLPPQRTPKNLPAVLIAHGGPLGISDGWDLSGSWENSEAQFLATRGYAVVQVEYRGSGGRGKAFEDSGKLQMGSGMMQDMLDGLNWAIGQGYVDKNRVCVYGASYGGYTAFFQPVYAPQGTFKCSVAIAGVADIRVQANRSDTRRSRAGKNFLRQAWGMDDPAYVAANSAIDHVDKFNVPVLIIHGEDDQRVPLKNAQEMRDALQKAGKPVEWMTRPKEGHGFYKEENNLDRYKITETFLEKYLGPGAPVTAATAPAAAAN
jgi:dipeptidyl aminopeptidase/acylaminoacyl peptidase